MATGITDKIWYYVQNGQHIGPLGEAEMRRLICDGRILPATLVWREREPDWIAAAQSSLKYIFADLKATAVESGSLPVQDEIRQPPELPFSAYALYRLWVWFALIAGGSIPLYFVLTANLSQKMTMGIMVAVALIASVVGYVLLYRLWLTIQDGAPRTTPGRAVGFCLIPLYNIYWNYIAYVGLADDINRYCDERNITGPRVNGVMARLWYGMLLCAMLPGIGEIVSIPVVVLQLSLLRQMVAVAALIISEKNR
jgi:hypothetical protein